jgi:hypothetical protein
MTYLEFLGYHRELPEIRGAEIVLREIGITLCEAREMMELVGRTTEVEEHDYHHYRGTCRTRRTLIGRKQ